MGRRIVAIAAAAFVVLLLATALPPMGWFGSFATVATGGKGHGPPVSEIQALPKYTTKELVEIRYTSYMHGRSNDDDDDGVDAAALADDAAFEAAPDDAAGIASKCGKAKDWTELYSRSSSEDPWTFYAPPWNTCGRWVGTKVPDSDHVVNGTIPFDSFYTGGEGPYQFTTVAVHHRSQRESGPGDMKSATTVDATAPQLFIATPVPDSWTNQDVLRWDARDGVSGVATVGVGLDGSEPTLYEQAQGSVDLATTEGTHTALVNATDRAGNRVEVSVLFHYDPTAPSLAITSPARDAFVATKDVTLAWTADSEGAPLASLRLSIDSNPPVGLATEARSYALSDLVERGHLVSLLAVDAASNIAMQSLWFNVDTVVPTLTVIAPTTAFVNTHDLQLYWVGSDSNSGIDHTELSLDGADPVNVHDAAGYAFPNVGAGAHAVVLRAVDRAGNVAEKTLSLKVDVTAPTVSVTGPVSGSTVYGTNVQVTWTADDLGSGIDRIEFVFDGNLVIATGATTTTLNAVAVGPHYAIVRVMDRAGNAAEAGVAFIYGGANPPGPLGISALDFGLLMLLLGAIAVASAYFAVRRRRKVRSP